MLKSITSTGEDESSNVPISGICAEQIGRIFRPNVTVAVHVFSLGLERRQKG